jgi:protein-S-isoprenylcysteine O-methyltransferase Ste14
MKILFLKTIIFTLLIPGTVAVIIPLSIIQGAEIGGTYSMLCGLLLMSIGVVIYAWCAWDFIVFGKGTPAPIDAPKHLVIRGLYHYSRNPMYVGVLFFISGWTLLYTVPLMIVYGLCVVACFQLFVVFYEEPMLEKLFGSEYEEYSLSVNRWLPGLFSLTLTPYI